MREQPDYLWVNQNPMTLTPILRLSNIFTMPVRVLERGLQDFRELTRAHGPESIEHVLDFTHLARQMMKNLHTEVPHLSGQWTQCSADLKSFYNAVLREHNGHYYPAVKTLAARGGSEDEHAVRGLLEKAEANPGTSNDNTTKQQAESNPDPTWDEWSKKCHAANTFPNPPLDLSTAPVATTMPYVVWLTCAAWVFHGQCISTSFDLYLRVFVKLLETGVMWSSDLCNVCRGGCRFLMSASVAGCWT